MRSRSRSAHGDPLDPDGSRAESAVAPDQRAGGIRPAVRREHRGGVDGGIQRRRTAGRCCGRRLSRWASGSVAEPRTARDPDSLDGHVEPRDGRRRHRRRGREQRSRRRWRRVRRPARSSVLLRRPGERDRDAALRQRHHRHQDQLVGPDRRRGARLHHRDGAGGARVGRHHGAVRAWDADHLGGRQRASGE